jgi:hypothetical protein
MWLTHVLDLEFVRIQLTRGEIRRYCDVYLGRYRRIVSIEIEVVPEVQILLSVGVGKQGTIPVADTGALLNGKPKCNCFPEFKRENNGGLSI